MTDVLTRAQRSACMAAVRSRNTQPERTVRRWVHGMGHRYSLHKRTLPGSPDLALVSRRAAIFVHGCFWHGHSCPRGSRVPVRNRDYWTSKIARNRERDASNRKLLRAMGWRVLSLWECELKEETRLRKRLQQFLDQKAAPAKPGRVTNKT